MMKQPVRIVLWVLCAVMILSAPLVFSSPNLLSEVKWDLMGGTEDDEEEEDDDSDLEEGLLRLFLSTARAEEEDLIIEESEDGPFGEVIYELPVDFSVAPAPNPDGYTEDGYEDETIRVTMEDREEDGVIWHLAFVQIASPTQLRTATAVPGKLTSNKVATVSAMAKYNHAIVALNGDNFVDKPEKTTFEYRMGEKVRNKGNRTKDVLIIDRNGDFHFVLADSSRSRDEHTSRTRKAAEEWGMVQAFTFGPALVIDGEVQKVDSEYGYNPNGKEPRAAIGQTGKLSYVLAIAEGRGESSGVTQQQLADYLGQLGCTQAFNLDGGNSAEMVFGEKTYKGMPGGAERPLSDIIYFATAVPEQK